MKSVLLILALAVASDASASTIIPVTGGGILDAQHFYVTGDNFSAGFSHPGVISAFPCRIGTTCNFSIMTFLGGVGGGGDEFFQGQSGETINGAVSVTGSITVPATGPTGFTVPVSVDASFTAFRSFLNQGSDPFFVAHVTGEGTLTSDGGGNPFGATDPTYIRFNSPIYQFSGTAEVTVISGSEAPEPSIAA